MAKKSSDELYLVVEKVLLLFCDCHLTVNESKEVLLTTQKAINFVVDDNNFTKDANGKTIIK